jgi:hypothetical protein
MIIYDDFSDECCAEGSMKRNWNALQANLKFIFGNEFVYDHELRRVNLIWLGWPRAVVDRTGPQLSGFNILRREPYETQSLHIL